MSFFVKAPLKLNIIVVGGGISGLAVAFRLTQAGHIVHVIDKSRPEQKACGVRVPPNLTKILEEWGLGKEVARWGQPTRRSHCYTMETGQFVGHLLWPQTEVLEEIGAEYLLMHYQDLHAMLYSAAKSAGVRISYDTPVTSVSANPPRVELASGTTLYADMIIGADGSCGIVREAVEGTSKGGRLSTDSFSVYVATISREQLRKDPELDVFTNPEFGGVQVRLYIRFVFGSKLTWHKYPIWMGTSCHAVGFPVVYNTAYTIHVFWPDSLKDPDDYSSEEWNFTIPRKKLCFSGDSKLKRLLDLCPTLQRRRYIKRDPLVEWTDDSGRIILMGEAAHPSLPCITHSASLQLEDAEVLGGLLSRLKNWGQLPQLVEAFRDLREGRCRIVHKRELMGFRLVWLPPGSRRDERDESLQAMVTLGLQGWSEDKMRWQWEEISEVLAYSAREAAEDWWVSWGMLRERSLLATSTFTAPLNGGGRGVAVAS
ncbi:hypothetical protein J3R83DRAFT_8360 [Lanmaoa asiatica]|nr:hypothetical protein J3R83DRAFT_8360 [Lanmaoa asiatica]